MTATTSHPEHASGRTPRRAALASFMGSAVEYYDFFLFGSAAALILPHVFFPSDNKAALVMSFATFGFAYIARPVGAVILGHFGDRIGRQRVLMFTLVLMGMSTFIIGCLPTFETIGWAAPALLVVCRLMQGFSAAGEQAGASSLTLEHSPDNQRAFFTSWTLTGTQGGLILASLILIPFMALPDEAKYSWGWRVPFWFSAVVVVVAFFIRRQLHETPQFTEAKEAGEIAKMPLVPLLRDHWRDVVRVILCAFIAAVSTVFANLALAYGKEVGLDADLTLWLVVAANVGALFTQPFFGKLADRIGRKPVFIYGAVASAVLMPFYMLSMSQDNHLLTFALAIATFSFGYAAANAVWPSFYGEMFSTRVRFSGMAIGTQLGFLMAGFAPSIVTALGGVSEGGWVVISLFTAVVCLIAAGAALTARETKDVPTVELGLPRSEPAPKLGYPTASVAA
ncbi:major facilitator superfamily MFS_1 [Gordonia bronchialis DSM 43247]|uniref:Major facilitator superfamily MFS_1 n=1 Tax=Gordonia bronchialis (strain ATCC 25592 / DSM 43247 / BCRC 13721 / JCM 3198 / KCTC 3076 / NBRC 16047 / NCTC 10667) TaxID=526226 RepID=D0LCQ3_GORB4|nr:MFS transporter [Gordonia bronchialis]ACY21574.1 major facilitator superfamily MFS_1 [Gordonia bronchialis DSM 43247]MCC3324359.1 MHS family MFS transporter [Gordonia bronchialis]QGS24786.1 MFS transporter [Gordonia bronchialis]UAK38968.1 MHS family MFS transporter [Gordonia bronchialis]STQ64457.1 Proline porter II [Gordonia bronchialis]